MADVAELRRPKAEAVPSDPLAKLREPFPANQISKLPKPYKKDSPKGRCDECGGYHGLPAVHLDYVGHAALTDRLLDTDPHWSWEPAGFTPEGLPAFDRTGGLWIKLTVCGVTRFGYGSADGKSGGDAVKEIIGDALRNAAMRFGAALDLWHKGDLHAEEAEPAPTAEERAFAHLQACGITAETLADAWKANAGGWKGVMDAAAFKRVTAEKDRLKAGLAAPPPREPSPKADEHRRPDTDDNNPFDDPIPF